MISPPRCSLHVGSLLVSSLHVPLTPLFFAGAPQSEPLRIRVLSQVLNAVLFVGLGVASSGCGPSSGTKGSTVGSGVVGGQQTTVQVDPNQGGKASSLRITEIRWGRLVDIYDAEDDDDNPATPPIRNLILREYLVSENIITDGFNYLLETSPFTEQVELTILADSDSDDPASGLPETEAERFTRLLEDATINLGFVTPTGLGSSYLPPFPLVPRNAALSITVSDLLDHSTVNEQTVRVLTGTPANLPFGARVLVDPNFGAFIANNGQLEFHSTRILVDFTVSEAEAATTTVSVNSLGLPPSTSNQLTNAILRFPTKVEAATGQFQIVRNVAGNGFDFTSNGPVESNLTADVIRTFRTGRSDDELSNFDPNNGFLLDIEPPRILGSQGITFTGSPTLLPPSSTEGDSPNDVIFLLEMDFATKTCAQTGQAGNILKMRGTSFSDLFAEVTRQTAPPQNGRLSDVRVRLLPIPSTASLSALRDDFLTSTSGEFQSVFSTAAGVVPNCFLQVSPTPGLPPVSQISTQSNITVRFSEPMNPETITAHETFRIDRLPSGVPPGPSPFQSIVGSIAPSPGLREFRFSPVTPFDHISVALPDPNDNLYLNLVGGPKGVVDLAGNPLADSLPADILMSINPTDPTVRTGGVVLSFDSFDEDGNSPIDPNDPSVPFLELYPEIRGQFVRDIERGVIRGREPARDSRVIDSTVPLIGLMTTTAGPLITPLVPFGSRMQTVWRYADVGFGLLDESTANVDVEGISYAPFSGQVFADFFDLFEISMAHSAMLPDEAIIPLAKGGGGFASYPSSGLYLTFAANALADPDNKLTLVHDRDEGYVLNPSQVFASSTGTLMMPYPMNRNGEQVSDFDYYTWRDTAILGAGGSKNFGADLQSLAQVGECATNIPTAYFSGSIRSLGLPLLMDFKCFQDFNALGQNGLATVFALPTQRHPIFRVFSSGSPTSESGGPIVVNPDQQATAAGGIVPSTGKPTPANDNTVMLGQLDFVVRVSRVHTIWFDTQALVGSGNTVYLDPVIEPKLSDQPSGTSIAFAYRGATTVDTTTTTTPIVAVGGTSMDIGNGLMYDAYGDPLETRLLDPNNNCPTNGKLNRTFADFRPNFFNLDGTWYSDIKDLSGARFIQVRITFIANTATGAIPELSTIAIPYTL